MGGLFHVKELFTLGSELSHFYSATYLVVRAVSQQDEKLGRTVFAAKDGFLEISAFITDRQNTSRCPCRKKYPAFKFFRSKSMQ
jgi:hypothetical protein